MSSNLNSFGCERLTACVPRLQALRAAGFQPREPRRVAGIDAVGAAQQHVSCWSPQFPAAVDYKGGATVQQAHYPTPASVGAVGALSTLNSVVHACERQGEIMWTSTGSTVFAWMLQGTSIGPTLQA